MQNVKCCPKEETQDLMKLKRCFIPEIESAAKIRKIAVYIFLIYLQVSELERFEEE